MLGPVGRGPVPRLSCQTATRMRVTAAALMLADQQRADDR